MSFNSLFDFNNKKRTINKARISLAKKAPNRGL